MLAFHIVCVLAPSAQNGQNKDDTRRAPDFALCWKNERRHSPETQTVSAAIQAVFEDGVLRPLENLSLHPNQLVTVRIDEVPDRVDDLEDKGFLEYCRAEGDPSITLEEVRAALTVIPGSMTAACSTERDED
jgi:predicted DNA-binding antitoxin AbrB/MazE fold protein